MSTLEHATGELLDRIRLWRSRGETFGLATVVDTHGSAPRPPGTAMAVSAQGEAIGSVSGGCVEAAVYELTQEVVRTGRPVLASYGISDNDAFAVGLTCGGSIDVFVEPMSATLFPHLDQVTDSVRRAEPVAVATVVEGRGMEGSRLLVWPGRHLGAIPGIVPALQERIVADVRDDLTRGETGLRLYPEPGCGGGEVTLFVQSYVPPPDMLIFGATEFAAALARMGKVLGYRVTVCDARAVFATSRRFPDADEIVVAWPSRYLAGARIDERTVVCVLTHDPKFDVPALKVALRTNAAYVGAMGSRRTHDDRLARLRAEGLTNAELARLASPIGLDIGARTCEETAVSIAAEIIASRGRNSTRRLTSTRGPIHARGDHRMRASGASPRADLGAP